MCKQLARNRWKKMEWWGKRGSKERKRNYEKIHHKHFYCSFIKYIKQIFKFMRLFANQDKRRRERDKKRLKWQIDSMARASLSLLTCFIPFVHSVGSFIEISYACVCLRISKYVHIFSYHIFRERAMEHFFANTFLVYMVAKLFPLARE